MSQFLSRMPLGQLENINQQSQNFKTRVALEETIRGKSEIIFRLKSQIASLEVEMEEKQGRRDELADLFESKTKETNETEQILLKEISEL